MIILLDIDGVMVTTPSWKRPEQLADGFMKFNYLAVANLTSLLEDTKAQIILTTTHRINFNEQEWIEIFKNRGISISGISKLNTKTKLRDLGSRAEEIREWVQLNAKNQNYVIIDDDPSINDLDEEIKLRWVATKSLIGFDDEARDKALQILKSSLK